MTDAPQPTESTLHALQDGLKAADINWAGPRGTHAVRKLKDGMPLELCIKEAIEHEANARQMWLEERLDPWRLRHGLTREQAISVAFFDDSFNPENPGKAHVTREDLFWNGNQHYGFVQQIRRQAVQASQAAQAPSTEELIMACLESGRKLDEAEEQDRSTTPSP